MPILWCGGEDIDFLTFTGCSILTTGGRFRSGYSRCVIVAITSAAAKSTIFPGGAITSGWLSCRIYPNTLTVSNLPIGLGDSATAKSGLYIGTSAASATRVALIKYDGTTKTELAAEVGDSLTNITLHKLDMQLINYGATATVNVYVDGVLVITYTGDVTVSGVTALDSVFLGVCSLNGADISEIIVADEDTRNLSLVTMAPNGAGDTQDWTGAYTDIDEITLDDADLIYTDVAAKDQQCNLINIPSGSFACKAVKISARATKSVDASIGTLKLGIKSGTVDVDAGHALTTGWVTYERLMLVNPVGGLAFTVAELNALQGDFQSSA